MENNNKKCKRCRKNNQWIPILNYCTKCSKFNGSIKKLSKRDLNLYKNSDDRRYLGQIHQVKSKEPLITQIDENILKKLNEKDLEKLKKDRDKCLLR